MLLRGLRLVLSFLKLNRSYLVHLPRSLRFNLRYFPLRTALRLPIFVSNRMRFVHLGGSIELEGEPHAGMVKIGFPTAEVFFDPRYTRGALDLHGKVKFRGRAALGQGTRIFVKDTGALTFGRGFWATSAIAISCHERIEFGETTALSFEILIMDTDTHKLVEAESDKVLNRNRPILIGDHVWVGCRSTILKGTSIGADSVVGAGSVVAGRFEGTNQLISGNPAKVMMGGISWAE